MNEVKKLVIIGSGPAGLTAAMYAARANLEPVVIAGLNPGGQLMQTTEVENFPGFPDGIQGPDLMANMIKQAERFGVNIKYENVSGVDFSKKPFSVKTENAEYLAATVILAMGAEAKWLGLENETRLRGHGVSACATCDGFFFKDKEIVVVGGGDSAMEEAIFLTKFASKVTIIHRSETFRASKIMLAKAQAHEKIKFMMNTNVIDVLGDTNVTGLKLKDAKTSEERDFAAQGLFLAIGHTPNSKLLGGQIAVNERGYINVENNTRTNIEGVFVAGDVGDPRYRQAVTAAGMGCMAAIDVEKYLEEMPI
jgi:thioredoxin reductase (NADPH)